MDVGNVSQHVKEYVEREAYYDFQKLESRSLQGDESAKTEIFLLWRMFYSNGIDIDRIVAVMNPNHVLKSFYSLKKEGASIRLYDLIPELSAAVIVDNFQFFLENCFDPKFPFAAAKCQEDGLERLAQIEVEDWLNKYGIDADDVIDLLIHSMEDYDYEEIYEKFKTLVEHGLSKANIENFEKSILENWEHGVYDTYRRVGHDIVDDGKKWESLGVNRSRFYGQYLDDMTFEVWREGLGEVIEGKMSFRDFLRAFDFECGVIELHECSCMDDYFKNMLDYCMSVGGDLKDLAFCLKEAVGYDEKAAIEYYMLLETDEKDVFNIIDPTSVANICADDKRFNAIFCRKKSGRRKVLKNFKKWGVDTKGLRKKFVPYWR